VRVEWLALPPNGQSPACDRLVTGRSIFDDEIGFGSRLCEDWIAQQFRESFDP
jgi:hypothetical protein